MDDDEEAELQEQKDMDDDEEVDEEGEEDQMQNDGQNYHPDILKAAAEMGLDIN